MIQVRRWHVIRRKGYEDRGGYDIQMPLHGRRALFAAWPVKVVTLSHVVSRNCAANGYSQDLLKRPGDTWEYFS